MVEGQRLKLGRARFMRIKRRSPFGGIPNPLARIGCPIKTRNQEDMLDTGEALENCLNLVRNPVSLSVEPVALASNE